MGNSITAKKLYERLLKDVFGKFNFDPDKWPNKPEDIGRTYFYDRKTKNNPFDITCSTQLRKLYNSALHGDMTDQNPGRVSIALNSVITDCFGYDFGFLTMIESDKEELKEKKISYWLTIIDKISTYAISHPGFQKDDKSVLKKEFDMFGGETSSDRSKADALPKENDESLNTVIKGLKIVSNASKEALKSNKPKESDISVSSVKEILKGLSESEMTRLISSVSDRTQINSETVDCIFFLDSIFIDIKEFVKDYRKRSSLHLCPFPEIEKRPTDEFMKAIVKNAWKEEVRKKKICPIYVEEDVVYKGYNIENIQKDRNNYTFYIRGNLELYYKLAEYLPLKLIIVVPENILADFDNNRLLILDDIEERSRFMQFKLELDRILADDELFPFFIKTVSSSPHYYAGLIDAIASLYTANSIMKNSFLDDCKILFNRIKHM